MSRELPSQARVVIVGGGIIGCSIGRDALLRQRDVGATRRLISLTLDQPEHVLVHNEPIYRDGAIVGRVTSGAFGYSIGRPVGLGWIEHERGESMQSIVSSKFEVEIAGERVAATAHARAPYKSPAPRDLPPCG